MVMDASTALSIAVEAGTCTILKGPMSCGKRSLVRILAAEQNKKLVEFGVTSETEETDLLGDVLPTLSNPGSSTADGSSKCAFTFWEGPLRRAVERGDWVLLPHVNYIRPEIVERLNSLGESPSSLHCFQSGVHRQVKVHADFKLFGTVTVGITNTFVLPRPFLSRCTLVEVSTPLPAGTGPLVAAFKLQSQRTLRALAQAKVAATFMSVKEAAALLCLETEEIRYERQETTHTTQGVVAGPPILVPQKTVARPVSAAARRISRAANFANNVAQQNTDKNEEIYIAVKAADRASQIDAVAFLIHNFADAVKHNDVEAARLAAAVGGAANIALEILTPKGQIALHLATSLAMAEYLLGSEGAKARTGKWQLRAQDAHGCMAIFALLGGTPESERENLKLLLLDVDPEYLNIETSNGHSVGLWLEEHKAPEIEWEYVRKVLAGANPQVEAIKSFRALLKQLQRKMEWKDEDRLKKWKSLLQQHLHSWRDKTSVIPQSNVLIHNI
jgi:hypothetical protein